MFTLKFVTNYNSELVGTDAISNTVSVSCDKYEVYRKKHLALVVANGVEYRVHGSPTGCTNTDFNELPLPPYHEVAFVENEAGKTIDRIGPYEKYDWYGEARRHKEAA